MKKIKKPKSVKTHFIQHCEIYDCQFMVFVGLNKQEVVRVLKRYEKTSGLIEMLEDSDWKNFGGLVIENDDKRALILPYFVNEWKYLTYLMHEIHHMTLLIAKQKGFPLELEATAYLFEYLFTEIRHRLDTKL